MFNQAPSLCMHWNKFNSFIAEKDIFSKYPQLPRNVYSYMLYCYKMASYIMKLNVSHIITM